MERGDDLLQPIALAFANGRANQRGLCGVAFAHGVYQRQGGFAFGQVIAEIFARDPGIAGVVEKIVYQLKRDADVAPVAAQPVEPGRIGPRQQSRALAGGGEQDSGFALDHVEVLFFAGRGVAGPNQLQNLAGGNGIGGVGHHFQQLDIVQGHHKLEGAGVQKIADQHAGRIAEAVVGGGTTAAQCGHVHHVVVQQSGRVNELHNRREAYLSLVRMAQGRGAEQGQQRTQALAPRIDDVLTYAFHHVHIGLELFDDDGIHRVELGADYAADLLHGGWSLGLETGPHGKRMLGSCRGECQAAALCGSHP